MLVAEQGQGRGGGERLRGDAGTGLISLLGGVLVFLVFLLFACHLLLNLYARSVVSGAAFDGAQYLARRGGDARAEAGARDTVAAQVGSANLVRVTRGGDQDTVEVTVEVRAPRLMVREWLPWSSDTIIRTARVRIERNR
jgi:hypothetical protein